MALISTVFVNEFREWIETQVSTAMQNGDTDVALHNIVCQEYRAVRENCE
jgi:hypothetical protein